MRCCECGVIQDESAESSSVAGVCVPCYDEAQRDKCSTCGLRISLDPCAEDSTRCADCYNGRDICDYCDTELDDGHAIPVCDDCWNSLHPNERDAYHDFDDIDQ